MTTAAADPKSISISRRLKADFEDVVDRATAELAKEGFGIMTTIDVQAKMKEKLDRGMDRFLILGACNPSLAWDAIHAVPEIGVLLPCNVVVRDDPDDPGTVVVDAMDPLAALSLIPDETIHRVGQEAAKRLRRVVASL